MTPAISRTLRVVRSAPQRGRWERINYRRLVLLRVLAKHVERKAS